MLPCKCSCMHWQLDWCVLESTCRRRYREDVVVVWAAAARQMPGESCLDQQGADFRKRQSQQLPWLPHLH